MTNYSEWVVKNEGKLKAFLKEYNDWVFGDQYYPNQKPGMLFVQGNVNDPTAREESHTVKRGEPIIVHVLGTNFIKSEIVSNGIEIGEEEDDKIMRHCRDEEGTDHCDNVRIKGPGDKAWADLDEHVVQVRTSPGNFTASAKNPDLDKWNPPMPSGPQRGAWSSKMLVLEVPETAETGIYELISNGRGSNNYEQRAKFKITVQ